MKISDVLKTVGVGIISAHPAGPAALALINHFLPEDKKLDASATGEQANEAISSLSPEEQVALTVAELDLKKTEEKGRTSRYAEMCQADGQETRAKLVDKAMNALICLSVMFVGSIGYVYNMRGVEAAFSGEMAAVFVTIVGPFAYVVRAYFGDLKTETESRHTVFDPKPRAAKGIAGVIQTIKGK